MNSKDIQNIIKGKLGKEWLHKQNNELFLNLAKEDKTKEKDLKSIIQHLESEKSQLDIEDGTYQEYSTQLDETIKSLKSVKIEKKKKEKSDMVEISREYQVVSSDLFKNKQCSSLWSPKCFVSINVSFSKRLEISPNLFDEDKNATFNLVYKHRGLLSDSKPINITYSPTEFKDSVLGYIMMMSLYDSSNILPFELSTPESCSDIIKHWDENQSLIVGKSIQKYFELDALNLGKMFKKHVENISKANVKEITVNEVEFKRKAVDDKLIDNWTNRKKAAWKNATAKHE